MRPIPAIIAASTLALASPTLAQQANPQIDYAGFVAFSADLAETRQAHLLSLQDWSAKAAQGNTIILDTRSAAAFAAGHIAGAINLPFSDFTDAKLAKILGEDRTRPILIYCNNNFSDNRPPVTSKRAPMALNIPTFINLHGYGYTNVWELAEVVSTADVAWTGEPGPPIAAAPGQP